MSIEKEIRLRAAPSPTGKVHIGTVRAYLPNYLLAKQKGGKNILRVENTDQKRNALSDNLSAAEAMIEAYEAVGITFDEGPSTGGEYGPYVQSERLDIYKKYADELIEKGHAYYCFCTKERLTELREVQKATKQKPTYDGHCRNLSTEEIQEKLAQKTPYVVRMKFPTEGETLCHDIIFGNIKVKNRDIEDQVLLKQDGWPTYHLAAVVDDHLMKISTVIRGVDWLPSFPKHVKLYEFFGWEIPEFAHLPLILNPDGHKKLSKRFGANSIIAKLREGYLREAIQNYSMLCGWAPDPKLAHQDEIYTPDELIQMFDLSRVNKTAARYDQKKFDYINGKHIRRFSTEELASRVLDWAENIVLKQYKIDDISGLEEWETKLQDDVKKFLPLWKADLEKFKKGLVLEKDRIIKLSELPYSLEFLYVDSFNFTDENWNTKNRTKEELATALEVILPRLDELLGKGVFDHEAWEKVVRGYAEEVEWKAGDLFLAIRSAVTGRLQSPPLLESIEAMGWPKAKKFFEQAIVWLKSN
jgi:glutamyl-tRNA synthetase